MVDDSKETDPQKSIIIIQVGNFFEFLTVEHKCFPGIYFSF